MAKKMNVLLPQPIEDEAVTVLAQGNVHLTAAPEPKAEVVGPLMKDAQAIVLRTGIKITRELLSYPNHLMTISRTGAGVDNVDLPAATEQGIIVTSSIGVNTTSVVEHGLALILALFKQLFLMDGEVRKGNFAIRYKNYPMDLREKTIGIVGFGRIGSLIAQACNTVFAMKVLAYDPFLHDEQKAGYRDWVTFTDLIDLCTNSDVISIHTPLNKDTENMFDRQFLARMKKTAFIINTSRGGVIKRGNIMKALPNYGRVKLLDEGIRTSLRALTSDKKDEGASVISGEEKYANHVLDLPITLDLFEELKFITKRIGVTRNFKEVIDFFKIPEGETPQGFRIEYVLEKDGVLRADLVRDISYDKNGQKRPTNTLFSADSANPYEVAPISNLIVNLTCNPGIIYDLFINNPKANVGGKFKTRDEVMQEIGRILGPGADISVELNNPFDDVQKCLDEAEKFREMLSPYRVVIKVPHTGPVNLQNMCELLEGEKKFAKKYDDGATADMVRGHNLALALRKHGFRINFTLMFEPFQTALALQAKPYFINSFIRHRLAQSTSIKKYLDLYRVSDDPQFLADLRKCLVSNDFIPVISAGMDLFEVKKMGERIVNYRQCEEGLQGDDGLDGVRHNLRILRHCNLPDTRLIICSMEGPTMYPEIDSMLTEEEFADVADRAVITAEPEYLARFTSTNQVISYQRRFLNAAKGAC